jgi:hypothetical protein
VQDHPVVRELLKRFTADVISREFLPKDDWLRRFGG